MVQVLQIPGRAALGMLSEIGRLSLFVGQALFWLVRTPWYGRQILRQIIDIGYYKKSKVSQESILASHLGKT